MRSSCALSLGHWVGSIFLSRTGSDPPLGDRWFVHLTTHKDSPKYETYRYGWSIGNPQVSLNRLATHVENRRLLTTRCFAGMFGLSRTCMTVRPSGSCSSKSKRGTR